MCFVRVLLRENINLKVGPPSIALYSVAHLAHTESTEQSKEAYIRGRRLKRDSLRRLIGRAVTRILGTTTFRIALSFE